MPNTSLDDTRDPTAHGCLIVSLREAEERARLAEEALHHAQKIGAIGRLTASVAHDFNNLLSVIHSSVTLLRKTDLTDERRTRCLDTLTRTTNQAIVVTRQLLDFARGCPFNPGVFRVAERVTALQDMFAMLCGSGIRIDMHFGEEPLYTLADSSRFDMVLVNLAINARDAMAGKGTLRIGIRPTSEAHASWRRCTREGNFVAVPIADTGPGIPEDYVDRIFEPFFTTKRVGLGTGMGLPQAADFAEQAGGLLEVDSTVGAGATFTIYLPRVHAPVDDERSGGSSPETTHSRPAR